MGKAGRGVLAECLPRLVTERNIDMVICNAENAAGGSGMTPQIFGKLLRYGVDVVTLGDHVYRKREVIQSLQSSDRIIRPGNLSPLAIGRTWTAVPTKSGSAVVGVACLLGQMYMGTADSPWSAVDRIWKEMPADVKIRVLDFHAEASSEKVAMGWHLDGRASIVFGTHTHIPTADYRILPNGTAHISDVGMTGPYDSVLGRRKDRVLAALTTSMPTHFEVASADPRMSAILVTVEATTGKATHIERIEVKGTVQTDGPYDRDDGMPGRHD